MDLRFDPFLARARPATRTDASRARGLVESVPRIGTATSRAIPFRALGQAKRAKAYEAAREAKEAEARAQADKAELERTLGFK